MTAIDHDLLESRRNEATELLIDADRRARWLATKTLAWLDPIWRSAKLPMHPSTGQPILTCDVLLHAGAVTAVMIWEHSGLQHLVGPHLVTAEDALHTFIERVRSIDGYSSNEGHSLFFSVSDFERRLLVPCATGVLDPDSQITVTAQSLEYEAIEELAELLFDFRHVLSDPQETHQ